MTVGKFFATSSPLCDGGVARWVERLRSQVARWDSETRRESSGGNARHTDEARPQQLLEWIYLPVVGSPTSFSTAAIYLVFLFHFPSSLIGSCGCATFLNASSEPGEVQFVAKHPSQCHTAIVSTGMSADSLGQWEEIHRRVSGAGGPFERRR